MMSRGFTPCGRTPRRNVFGDAGKSGFSETVVVTVISAMGLALAIGLMQARDEARRSTAQVEAQRAADRAALDLALRQAENASLSETHREPGA